MDPVGNKKHFERLEKHSLIKRNVKKNRKAYQIGCLTTILGLISSVYSVRMFNFSIFQFKYYLLNTIVSGLIIFFLLNYFQTSKPKLILNYYEIWLYGSIFMGTTFFVNKYASFAKNFEVTLPIIEKHIKHSFTSRGLNDVDIYYNGIEQNILLPRHKIAEVEKADSITMLLNKGLFGIETIVMTTLK